MKSKTKNLKSKSKKQKERKKNRKKSPVARTNVSVTIVPKEDEDTSLFAIDVKQNKQRGMIYYTGEITLEQLERLTDVDGYDGMNGYQRQGTEENGYKFANFMAMPNSHCPAPILINDRNGQYCDFISLNSMNIKVSAFQKLAATHGVLKIDELAQLWVYDGGTRRFGYLELLRQDRENGTSLYKHIRIPFCLTQVSYGKEVTLFLLHNNRQKKMSAGHRGVVTFHCRDEIDENVLTKTEKVQSIQGGVARILNDERTSPWYNIIIMPENPQKGRDLVGTIGGIFTGVEPLLYWLNKSYWSEGTQIKEKSEDIAKFWSIFWHAVRKICPKMWANKNDYLLCKSKGVGIMGYLIKFLFVEFFNTSTDWTVENISRWLAQNNILTSPRFWIKDSNSRVDKCGIGRKHLRNLGRDMFDQMKDKM